MSRERLQKIISAAGVASRRQAETLIDIAQQAQDRLRRLRVERRCRFIAQQQLRMVGQGAGDADALFLPA